MSSGRSRCAASTAFLFGTIVWVGCGSEPAVDESGGDRPSVLFTVQLEREGAVSHYQLGSAEPRPCSIGLFGENMLAASAIGDGPLRYAELYVPGFVGATGETKTFAFGVSTAELDVRIDTIPTSLLAGGNGTAAYADEGSIRVHIVGESGDGVGVEATVECSSVQR